MSALRRTTGRILADRLACPFFDGDDFHPAANKGRCSHVLSLSGLRAALRCSSHAPLTRLR